MEKKIELLAPCGSMESLKAAICAGADAVYLSLKKFGARIDINKNIASIDGNSNLFAANVSCTDLRGGAALLVAALSAEGRSVIDKIHHIDRGYERIEDVLKSIGANIKRID